MPTNNRANQLNPNNPAFDPVLAAATKQLSPGNPAAYHQAQVYRPKNESLHIGRVIYRHTLYVFLPFYRSCNPNLKLTLPLPLCCC